MSVSLHLETPTKYYISDERVPRIYRSRVGCRERNLELYDEVRHTFEPVLTFLPDSRLFDCPFDNSGLVVLDDIRRRTSEGFQELDEEQLATMNWEVSNLKSHLKHIQANKKVYDICMREAVISAPAEARLAAMSEKEKQYLMEKVNRTIQPQPGDNELVEHYIWDIKHMNSIGETFNPMKAERLVELINCERDPKYAEWLKRYGRTKKRVMRLQRYHDWNPSMRDPYDPQQWDTDVESGTDEGSYVE